MTWRRDRLPELARLLAGRPRHEALRGHVTELLRSGFGAPYEEIAHETYLLDNSGRIDTMWGATVIELKSDLRRETGDVLARMPAYLADAAARSRSPRPVTGLATDGATFVAYGLRDGALQELARTDTDPERPDELMAWLEPLLSDRPDLLPEPRAVAQAFGRASLTFGRARLALDALWAELRDDPEVRLKRELWDGLLREAYGESVGEDSLFLQHTYLATVVKAIAARVLDLPVDDPAALLSGRALADEGIIGAVEADFFDWPLRLPAGAELVRQIAQQTARFRLRDVESDVLKILYESLVDPDQRHDLGEYYTPDWLAARVVAEAVDAPLEQRVLDPACGSGTFLFHAVRRLAAAGRAAGWDGARILQACAENVRGLDVHPVAVTLARVTWLLALGGLVAERAGPLRVPVFLGDAMQWNLRRYLGGADVLVEVPGEAPLQIPAGFAEDQALFEQGLDALSQGLLDGAAPAARRRVRRRGGDAGDLRALAGAVSGGPQRRLDLRVPQPGAPGVAVAAGAAGAGAGRQPAVDRLSPPQPGDEGPAAGGAAILRAVGRRQAGDAAGHVRLVLGARGGALPFAARADRLRAAVRRAERAGVRRLAGRADGGSAGAAHGGWALEKVWPIFGAQSGSSTTSTCVLFGQRVMPGAAPAEVERWEGRLPRRDANDAEAALALTHSRVAWPRARTLVGASPYRARFRQGATIVPRRFFIVEPEPLSRLGGRRDAPRMRGRAGPLDKAPWTGVEPPRGPVEKQFLRQVVLGETIAPFRLLDTVTAVIPLDGARLLDAAAASDAGHRYLAAWLRDAEAKWAEHSNKGTDGKPRMTLLGQIDHMRKLSVQAGPSAIRVLYAASGTRLSAARVLASDTVVEHAAYWAVANSADEAAYLVAIVNSAAALAKVTDLQPHGQRDKRHFDNLVWTLPIPEYDAADPLHRDLAAAAARAEAVAAGVELTEAQHFTAKRRAIRAALAEDGVAAEMEALVDALLPP